MPLQAVVGLREVLEAYRFVLLTGVDGGATRYATELARYDSSYVGVSAVRMAPPGLWQPPGSYPAGHLWLDGGGEVQALDTGQAFLTYPVGVQADLKGGLNSAGELYLRACDYADALASMLLHHLMSGQGETETGSTVASAATTITLAAAASAVNGHYVGWTVTAASQVRRITVYVGATRIATVDVAWTPPGVGVGYTLESPVARAQINWTRLRTTPTVTMPLVTPQDELIFGALVQCETMADRYYPPPLL